MNYKYTIPAALIGVSIALVQTQTAFALSSSEVSKRAKQITVLIESITPGSGVIIKRSDSSVKTYTVLTAAHVVSGNKAEIVTPDGKRYPLKYNTVKSFLPEVDLAIFQFTSSNNYSAAKIGDSDQSPEGTIAYLSGFPIAKANSISRSIYNFTDGKIQANASQPLKDGYALVYSNITLPGMSGGPVFNDKGELIGVHGKGDQAKADIQTSNINADVSYIKSGFNLGIPINTFLRLSAKSGIDFGVSPPPERVSTAPKADDFLIQALDKYQKGDYQGAIVAYDEAVRLNPKLQAAIVDHYQQSELNRKSTEAYSSQGLIRLQVGDIQGAFADFNQALKINPNDAIAYIGRGTARYELGDKKAAIADFNQAIKINPNNEEADSFAYALRGIARFELGEKQAAIEDFKQAFKINPNLDPRLRAKISQYYQQPLQNLNPTKTYTRDGFNYLGLENHQEALAAFNQALQVNPNDALAYIGRGTARYKLGDKKDAITDFNQALKINSNLVLAYARRGAVRLDLGDKQGAITDFNQAFKVVLAYAKRGAVRLDLGGKQGAMDDFNQAFKISPNIAEVYRARGSVRYLLGDKKGSIDDMKKAVNLFQQQGNQIDYQKTLQLLNQLQRQ